MSHDQLRTTSHVNRRERALLEQLFDAVRHPSARRGSLADVVATASADPEAAFRVLSGQALCGVFAEGVRDAGVWQALPPRLRVRLSEGARLVLATRLLQGRAAMRAASVLEAEGVPYVFFKGLHLQELLYRPLTGRPMADVDVLIPRERRREALRLLAGAGFRGTPLRGTVSHEVPLRGHGVELDVHWSTFRPGRARTPPEPDLLNKRQELGSLWVPSDAHTMWLLLVHSVVTEHATMRLIHAVDLDRRVRIGPIAWDAVLEILRATGLCTAAWVMCEWTRGWLDTPVPESFLSAVAPNLARRAYLRAWLRADPAEQFSRWPNLVRGTFGLAIHDAPGDMARALAHLVRERRASARECACVASALSLPSGDS